MITTRIVADQVLIRLSAGFVDIANSVQREDVYKALEQKINALFKMEHFNSTLPSGNTIPQNLSLATYTDIPVYSYTKDLKSICTLPVMPISLPLNMGIYEIIPAQSLLDIYQEQFIPLQYGQSRLLQTDKLLNDLMGEIGYEPNGNKVLFTKNIINYGVNKVDMKLVVMDISQYSETDPLPVPADYEQTIIDDLIKAFAPVKAEPELVSNYPFANTETQTQPNNNNQ